MKKILFIILLLFSVPTQAGTFCSYSAGTLAATDLFLKTASGCGAGTTTSVTSQNLIDYTTLLNTADKMADYTLTSSDNVGGRFIRFQSTGNLTLTIPLESVAAMDTGRDIGVSMWGGGDLGIAFSSAGIVYTGALTFSSSSGRLINFGTDSWAIEGGQ